MGLSPDCKAASPGELEIQPPMKTSHSRVSEVGPKTSLSSLVSPVCSQDSEIDAELLKPSLEESGNVGCDQRIFLFNKHHRNHFFIQQVWGYCFKGPEIKPLCVMASELLYLEFCVFGHESLFLFKILLKKKSQRPLNVLH